MRHRARCSPLIVACAIVGCRDASGERRTHAAPATSASTSSAVQSLRRAETRRDSAAISPDALSSRDPAVRRAAARALSRIADARAADSLLLALSDEDPEVVTWAAYGLGYACAGREAKTIHALVARAASIEPNARLDAPLSSPSEAISDALGRCAGTEAESTLRSWLAGPVPRAEAAALALGRLASQRAELADETLVALLEASDRPENPLQNGLYPCARLPSYNASTSERVRTLAARLLAKSSTSTAGPARQFALGALARAGQDGPTRVAEVLADRQRDPNLRAQAARELGLLGDAGQRALRTAFDELSRELASDADLLSADYAPFSATLDALALPVSGLGGALLKLAQLAVDPRDAVGLQRRKAHVRCTAAALLVGSNYHDPRLLACDASPESRVRELSVLSVIAREQLRGARKRAYLRYLDTADPALREAALTLLTAHGELTEAYQLLAHALVDPAPGVVASAAEVLRARPERAAKDPGQSGRAELGAKPDPSVVQGLTRAYAALSSGHNLEIQSLLLDAIGALQVLSLKEAVTKACSSDSPTLREHAQKALHLLGEQGRHCDTFSPQSTSEAEFDAHAAEGAQILLSFETDVGNLTLQLDRTFAPNAVARIVNLVETGFYDGVAVHRVVPGFVAQFGDPAGDGYGGDDQPALRCETSPVPFEFGSIGVALAGRDTGSSQLFIALGRYPHLDGEYAWLGRAGPGWERLTAGDRILHAHASSLP